MLQQRGCNRLSLYWLGRWLQHLINSSSIVTYFWGTLVFHLPQENLFHGQLRRETLDTWKLLSKLLGELPQLGSHSSNCHFLKTFKKIIVVLYVGKGLGLDPSKFLDPSQPIGLRGSQILKGVNLDPSPIQKTPR